jgi:hypothetical protein
METYVVRVWVPDRPGALGQVASRIGAAGGDVVGIEILERGAGKAIDELIVTLPSSDRLELLINEIAQVDDAAVEEVRHLDGPPADPEAAVLDLVADLAEAAAGQRLDRLCRGLWRLLGADWVAAVDLTRAEAVCQVGEQAPSSAWLSAFIEGSRHLPAEALTAATPADLTWTVIADGSMALALGRHQVALRARERRQVVLLGRILDALGA